jgi:hypothetical protein
LKARSGKLESGLTIRQYRLKIKQKLGSLLILVSLLTSGCQLPPQEDPDVSAFMLIKNDNQPVFKAIDLRVSGFESGELFKAQPKFYPLIEKKFQRSGLFELGEASHQVELHWESWKRDRALPDIPDNKSHSKWSLLESNAEMFHRMEVIVKRENEILKRYEYNQLLDHRGRGYLDNANRYLSWFHFGVNPMLRQFFLDLKRDGYLNR